MAYKLLIINPGSTSTKIGVYENESPVFVETIRHATEEIEKFNSVVDRFEFRKDTILRYLRKRILI